MNNAQAIAFIGGGNIVTSLIAGLTLKKFNPDKIWVSDPDSKKLHLLHANFNVNTTTDNNLAVSKSDICILAVKPQIIMEVCKNIVPAVQQGNPVVISVAAGVLLNSLYKLFGTNCNIIRTMPTITAAIGEGATALFAKENLATTIKNNITELFNLVGEIIWLKKEDEFNAFTSFCSSAPGIIFYLIDMIEQAGKDLGFSDKDANQLALQTIYASTKFAKQSTKPAIELCHEAATPNGTTDAALKVLAKIELPTHFKKAFQAAQKRSQELSLSTSS